MTFGFLLGGAFLTLFGLFERRGTSNRFLNSLIGVGAGVPLGVCVNCAAPIARGLHSSGARIETTLSAMFSSPTLNIIVVTMMFSIFPIYLTAIKLGTTLFFLLIVIPLLSRTVFKNESADSYDDTSCPVPTGGFREVLLRYEEEPRISMSEPDCSDKTILYSGPDSEGVFRYTSRTSQPMNEQEVAIYCEYDWSKEKEALRAEALKQIQAK